jgi:hypothetical protein
MGAKETIVLESSGVREFKGVKAHAPLMCAWGTCEKAGTMETATTESHVRKIRR